MVFETSGSQNPISIKSSDTTNDASFIHLFEKQGS